MKMRKVTFRLLSRDWRARELITFFLALLIATVCTSSIQLYTDRLQRGLNASAAEILGGDLVIESSRPFTPVWQEMAGRYQLEQTSTVSFYSMVRQGSEFVLASIKAVSDNYPLIGQLKVSDAPFAVGRRTETIPKQGHAWLQSRLFATLRIKIGDVITIGNATFIVSKVLNYEPDRAGDIVLVSPRILINQQDLAKTNVIQPGSRLKYHTMLVGDAEDVERYVEWAQPKLETWQRLSSPLDENVGIGRVVKKILNYINLASIAGVILSGVAIAFALDRYTRRHQKTAALLRCFGAQQHQITLIFLLQISLLAIAAILLGCTFGYLGQQIISIKVANYLALNLPPLQLRALGLSIGVGILLVLGFAFPPLMDLKRISTQQLLHEQPVVSRYRIRSMVLVVLALFLILQWQLNDTMMIFWFAVGLSAAVLLLLACGYGLILVTRRLHGGVSWRYGIANIHRRSHSSLLVMLAVGLVLLVVLLLQLLSAQLFDDWQLSLPDKTPNYFLFNIPSSQVSEFDAFVKTNQIKSMPLYPIVRGRLVQHNGKDIRETLTGAAQQENVLSREINLTWSQQIPSDNKILSGSWWSTAWQSSDTSLPAVSVEGDLAKRLDLKIGDTVGFNISGSVVTARIRNFRQLEWQSFKPNFFFVYPDGVLNNYPVSYLTSFYLAPEQRPLLSGLLNQLPSATLIDVDDIVARLKSVTSTATNAINYLLFFMLLIGVLILIASIQLSSRERRHDVAILRALGATKRQIIQSFIAEFATLGGLAGLAAALTANLLTWLLASQFFLLNYAFKVWPFIVTPLVTAGLITLVGYISCAKMMRTSPTGLLRSYL